MCQKYTNAQPFGLWPYSNIIRMHKIQQLFSNAKSDLIYILTPNPTPGAILVQSLHLGK